MTVEVTEQGNAVVAKVSGELDLLTAPSFRAQVDEALSADGPRNLILELSELSFVDSSGLGAILGRYKLVTQLGGRMVLVCPQEQVHRIFSLSGLFKIMDPAPNLDQALTMVLGG
jgi:stage II sporulation protein AA (anti-sigma F factor antagonist)